MGVAVPHCLKCDRYFRLHGARTQKHFCHFTLSERWLKMIHNTSIATSPYWCPKRKEGYK